MNSFLKKLIVYSQIILGTFSPLLASDYLSNKNQSFFSQASQDNFVFTLLYGLLNNRDEGYYLEIGAGNPTKLNNTYFLEKNLGWKGLSLDISPNFSNTWSEIRSNPLLLGDATKLDYSDLLQEFPTVIDYLSLDIDRDYDTVLKKICFDTHIFKIITIEHDYYRLKDQYRKKEREILTGLGYYLLCSDVMDQGYIFEDWWIYPAAFPEQILNQLTQLELHNKEHKYIISQIQSLIGNCILN